MIIVTLSEDQFVELYRPIVNHLDHYASFDWGEGRGTLFETFGKELDFVRAQPRSTVWTLLSVDGLEYIVNGYHFVNRLGYFVSRVPVTDGIYYEVVLCYE